MRSNGNDELMPDWWCASSLSGRHGSEVYRALALAAMLKPQVVTLSSELAGALAERSGASTMSHARLSVAEELRGNTILLTGATGPSQKLSPLLRCHHLTSTLAAAGFYGICTLERILFAAPDVHKVTLYLSPSLMPPAPCLLLQADSSQVLLCRCCALCAASEGRRQTSGCDVCWRVQLSAGKGACTVWAL